MRNDSNDAQTPGHIGPHLHIGDESFAPVLADPPFPPYVFPHSQSEIVFFFDLPRERVPTEMHVESALDDEEDIVAEYVVAVKDLRAASR